MAAKENELEFMQVGADDDDDFNNSMNSGNARFEESGGDDVGNWFLNQSKHPVTVVFHLMFKSAALFMYLFGSFITTNFIFIFVICIVLLAFDFWTVKNLTGRLLVGLRWWSHVKEDGSNEWGFESLEDMAEISAFDSKVFWGGLYISPLIWACLLLLAILRLRLEYVPVIVSALGLNMANVVGYVKCSSSAKEKMASLVEAGMKSTSMAALENSSFRNWLLSAALNVSGNAAK